MNEAHYQVKKSRKGFYFLLIADNSKVVGGSWNEYYPTYNGCEEGIVAHHIASFCSYKSEHPEDEVDMQTPEYRKMLKENLKIVDKTKRKRGNTK